MKRWMAIAVCIAALAAPKARADEASKQAKVQELFTVMHMNRMMEQTMSLVTQQIQQSMKTVTGSSQLDANQQKVLDAYFTKMMSLSKDMVGWQAIEPEYVKLYAATYSEEEIDGILAFYKSPAGQSMLAKTPELTTGSMKIVSARMVEFQPKMQQLVEEMKREMEAASRSTGTK